MNIGGGWIDAINIGQATGTFLWRTSSTDTCSDQINPDTPTFILGPSAVNTQIFYGKGPADFYLCLMREVGVVPDGVVPDWREWIKKYWLPLTVLPPTLAFAAYLWLKRRK